MAFLSAHTFPPTPLPGPTRWRVLGLVCTTGQLRAPHRAALPPALRLPHICPSPTAPRSSSERLSDKHYRHFHTYLWTWTRTACARGTTGAAAFANLRTCRICCLGGSFRCHDAFFARRATWDGSMPDDMATLHGIINTDALSTWNLRAATITSSPDLLSAWTCLPLRHRAPYAHTPPSLPPRFGHALQHTHSCCCSMLPPQN